MEKNIYSGEAVGLFSEGEFLNFMKRWRGAVRVSLLRDELPLEDVYHISPQEVTLVYDFETVDSVDKADVTAFGRRSGIGEVERRILREAMKYEKREQASEKEPGSGVPGRQTYDILQRLGK